MQQQPRLQRILCIVRRLETRADQLVARSDACEDKADRLLKQGARLRTKARFDEADRLRCEGRQVQRDSDQHRAHATRLRGRAHRLFYASGADDLVVRHRHWSGAMVFKARAPACVL